MSSAVGTLQQHLVIMFSLAADILRKSVDILRGADLDENVLQRLKGTSRRSEGGIRVQGSYCNAVGRRAKIDVQLRTAR